MVVVEAGGAGHVVVGLGAGAQTLAVATLPLVRAGKLAVFWAYWRRRRKMGKRSVWGGCKQSALQEAVTTKSWMIKVKKKLK